MLARFKSKSELIEIISKRFFALHKTKPAKFVCNLLKSVVPAWKILGIKGGSQESLARLGYIVIDNEWNGTFLIEMVLLLLILSHFSLKFLKPADWLHRVSSEGSSKNCHFKLGKPVEIK